MARKSKASKAFPQASITNQDLIEQCIVQFNMVDEDSNQRILEMLLTQPHNLDCIVDDKDRASVAAKYGWSEPTEADRVQYCLDQAERSTAKSVGGQRWLSLVDGDELADRNAYHELRNQRLREQIRQKKKKMEGDLAERQRIAAAVDETGESDTINWEDADDEPIERINTWHPKLDEWFGKSVDTIRMPNGKTETVVSHGIAKGFSYGFGAPKGMGKTRLMVRMLRDLCGPRQVREDGVEFGGHTGLYIQGEESMGMFRSLFLRGVWNPGEVRVDFSKASTLDKIEHIIRRDRPEIIVIDSKDMVYEFTKNDQRVRDGIMRFNAILDEVGATAFIISHIAKSTGDIKGSSMFGHMVRAVILGEKDEHMNGAFNLTFDKNRGGMDGLPLRWKHTDKSVELDVGKIIKDPAKPEMTRVDSSSGSYSRGGGDGSVHDAIARAMESAGVIPGRSTESEAAE